MKSLLLLPLLFGCGSAEILAPEPLAILDTDPGNGSVILPGDHPIAILFSEDVDSAGIEAAARLEETTEQAAPIRDLPLSLDRYDADTFTAILHTEALPPSTIYALTISADELRAVSGARMPVDLIRRFRTSD